MYGVTGSLHRPSATYACAATVPSGQNEHQAQGVLGDRAGVAARGVHHQHAASGRGLDIDMVGGAPADAHEFEAVGLLEHLFEDEVGLDDQQRHTAAVEGRGELVRVGEAARLHPGAVLDGHASAQPLYMRLREWGENQSRSAHWRDASARAASTPLRTAPSIVDGQPVSVKSPARKRFGMGVA